MSKPEKCGDWLTSKEAERALHVDSCKLMHLRLEGRLRFRKRGNAFMYSNEDIAERLKDVGQGARTPMVSP
jgi:hypothetical protein